MDPLQFLQEMIRIDSSNPPGNEGDVAKLLANQCDQQGIPYRLSEVDFNRLNFEIVLKGTGERSGKLMFCGHMDTVLPGEQPWDYSPFSGEVIDGKIYGRGASDMKSGLSAMFLALEAIHQEKIRLPMDLVFLATAGEEVDSCGARKYLEENKMDDIEALVIGEPTKEKVVVGHKGAYWLEIVTIGKTAHGAMPDQGINAVEWMKPIMEVIETYKSKWKVFNEPLGESSVAVTKVNGGIQTNVIPDYCSLHLDIRSIPPQSHDALLNELKESIQEIVSKPNAPVVKINQLLDRPSILTDPTSPLIETALNIKGQNSVYGVSYYTDGAVLNPESEIPTLIYGPGDERLAHQPNEYVDIHAYLRSIDFYKELALTYSGIK
ncbi:M20 family metallopeptidase [Ornithinibacillus halophilus]|uniref:Probable succinyl-diaminopimelate desuccinylase n=1 Tax=Ornithinibacillus halophilus TaxID=930117 RepID=A0A1M5FMM0_9BACI|nr:M20 family metallopeptidase [Ornithinibacillus halophilus]SHF92746.1 succinyl-diaminopimelate desuccinylase [Ornithinibacillus halophilus]